MKNITKKSTLPNNMSESLLLRFCFKYQKKLFFLLFLLIFCSVFLLRALQQKIILTGNQAYYLLALLHIPETHLSWLWMISPAIAFFCCLLLWHIAVRLRISRTSILFFLVFLLLTPVFTFSFTTFTLQSVSLLFFLLGIFLFFHKKKWLSYFSPISFLAAMAIDIFSSLLVILLLVLLLPTRKEKKLFAAVLVGILCFTSIIFFFFLHQPLFLGPFQEESLVKTLFADLGSEGISIFLILLGCIGIAACWKNKPLRQSYLLLGGSFLGILLMQRNALFFAVMVAFFAAEGAFFFYKRKWAIHLIGRSILFVIALGILLTFLVSLQQYTAAAPSWTEMNAFSWMKEHIPSSAKVFSLPENSYRISYFSGRSPFLFPHERNKEKEKISQDIFSSTYISTTFPLLESQNITFLYFTPEMKKNFPAEEGLFFLLRNERFKLRFSQQGYEVWEFKNKDTFI